MATRTKPAVKVTVCDACGREDTYLRECIACGREFCFMCDGIFPGCFIGPRVCRHCPQAEAVQKLCDKFSPAISKIVQKRDAEIKKLRSGRLR